MASSLVRAGHDVILFDADRSKAKKLAAETGASLASSLRELAQKSSSIVTMLPNTPHVEAVYLGNPSFPRPGRSTDTSPSLEETVQETVQNTVLETVQEIGGILDWVRPGSLVIDSSTIDPLASRRINAAARAKAGG
ncbi:unnamed protein product [Laminaria digitata]